MSHIDGGPSAKFLVRNLHSMNELNMIGNCLKGSRPILSFDPKFDEKPHLNIIKNLLFNVRIFNFFNNFFRFLKLQIIIQKVNHLLITFLILL